MKFTQLVASFEIPTAEGVRLKHQSDPKFDRNLAPKLLSQELQTEAINQVPATRQKRKSKIQTRLDATVGEMRASGLDGRQYLIAILVRSSA